MSSEIKQKWCDNLSKLIDVLIKNIKLKLEYIELDKERCDLEHLTLVIEYEKQCLKELKKLRLKELEEKGVEEE